MNISSLHIDSRKYSTAVEELVSFMLRAATVADDVRDEVLLADALTAAGGTVGLLTPLVRWRKEGDRLLLEFGPNARLAELLKNAERLCGVKVGVS